MVITLIKTLFLDPDNFLHFEHSDGANFWMINFFKALEVIRTIEKILMLVLL